MDGTASLTPSDPSPARPENARIGFRQLTVASIVGLVGQILIWGSVIALWVVGSLYSDIPVHTNIAYGASGFNISARSIFALNYLLVAGAVVALLSLILSSRGFQKIARAAPPLNVGPAVWITTVGTIGLGMFAVGWALWLGSFVAPGAISGGNASAYTSVIGSNLVLFVDLLLVAGGLLAFLGMLGIALGSSTVGTTYDEGAIELGGALSMLPVFSIIGYSLSTLGLARGERKLRRGWTPPPPPPPPPSPPYPTMIYTAGYPAGPPMMGSGQPGSSDSIVTVLIVVLVLLWASIIPIALVLSIGEQTRGPSFGPGGNATPTAGPSGSTPAAAAVVFLGLAVTAVLLPLAIVRNRRKKQRPPVPPVPPPPPPVPPPVAGEEDSLDHLV